MDLNNMQKNLIKNSIQNTIKKLNKDISKSKKTNTKQIKKSMIQIYEDILKNLDNPIKRKQKNNFYQDFSNNLY